ncbi:MAG: preprotein translocase subunit SecE [Clostridia bacterium]|nr:preprotein translocase subunit SecE [Clostridia bacterium]
MAEKKQPTDKNELKALKEAEKAAKKAKQERIKASKPKKEGTVFSRAGKSVSKFFKDFVGTCKKVVWPAAPEVLKNSAIVLAVIAVVGLVIFGFDQGLTALFGLGTDVAVEMGEQFADETTTAASTETTTAAETTTADSEETTDDAEETTAEETTAEETTVEETTEEEETTSEETTAE